MYKPILKYILLPFLTFGVWACNENVVINEPGKPEPPVIYSFTPSNGNAGTLIEIKGANLAKVETVTLGTSKVNLLKERISDEYITATLEPGVSSGKLCLESRYGRTESQVAFYVDLPFSPQVNFVPATAVINERMVIKGARLDQITTVFFRRIIGDGYEDVPSSFSFRTADSIGIVVPPVQGGKAYFGYKYDKGGVDDIKLSGDEIAIGNPNLAFTSIPDTIYSDALFELRGDNLNVIGSATVQGGVVRVLKDVASKYSLLLKVTAPAGQKYKITFQDGNNNVLSANKEVEVYVAEKQLQEPVSVFEFVGLNSQAYVRSITSTNVNKQYYIYELPMENKVKGMDEFESLPTGLKSTHMGYLDLKYDVSKVVSLGATITGGVAFAQVSPITSANAKKLKQFPDPVLHFWVNTYDTLVTCEFNVMLAGGYYFSNGYRQANAVSSGTTSTFILNTGGQWKLIAINLGDLGYVTGSSSYPQITGGEVQKAFYQGRVEEVRLRMRTTKKELVDTETVRIATAGFFVSDRVRKDVADDVIVFP